MGSNVLHEMVSLEDYDKITVNTHNKFKRSKEPVKRQRWS